MKKTLFVLAALAAVFIGFSACSNGSSDDNGGGTPEVPKPVATLSVYAPAMKLDLAKGQPEAGEKFKPLVEGVHVTTGGDGKTMLTVKFRKSYVKVGTIESNTFIDPRNSKPGYYDMDGNKQDATFTVSTDDTAKDPKGNDVHYVTSMTFPASKDKSEYFLWLYINSTVMGAQSGDGKGTAGPNKPNEHSKYEGKFTINWAALTGK